MNAFLFIVMLFTGIVLFFTVTVFRFADIDIINDAFPLEGTPYYVRYTTHIPSGIYDGDEKISKLLIEGKYGHGWAATVIDDILYCNEYHETRLGFMTCDLVRIDLNDFSKQLILKDTMLRGRCTSGELICCKGILMPGWFSDNNPLASLYSFASFFHPSDDGALVCFLDPKDAKIICSLRDDAALTQERADYYMNHSLEEIRP